MSDLDGFLADPTRVAELQPDQAAALMGRLAALQAILASRVVTASLAGSAESVPVLEDRLLAPPETAMRLGVNLRWLYRHADQLPFTRRLSQRTLRFSETGIARFLAEKKPLKSGSRYA